MRAAADLQEWAKDKVAPREEGISQLRNLIRRIEADVSEFDDQDQALIAEAVSVIRKARQTVNLGMPSAGTMTCMPPSTMRPHATGSGAA